MLRRLVVRLALCTGAAGLLLGVVAASDGTIALLPADASAVGVMPGAVLLALLMSVVAEAIRRRRS